MNKSLKNEIDNTDRLKNNIIKIKENINNEIVSLGESEISNLFETPNKLEAIMASCVKTATVSLNHKYTINGKTSKNFSIPINASFVPKIIYFETECNGFNNGPLTLFQAFCWARDNYSLLSQTTKFFGLYGDMPFRVTGADASKVSFSCQNNDSYDHAMILKKIIAIG